MAKPLIQFLSESSGFCCQWAFLTQPKYAAMTNKELARHLGVGERTVAETRSMLNNGAFGCLHRPGCKEQEKKDGKATP